MRTLHRSTVLLLALASAACGGNSRLGAGRPLAAEVVPGHVYEAQQVTEHPRPINMPAVLRMLERAYPPALRVAGIEGRSWVSIVVDEQGQVVEAVARQTSSHLEFDQAAVHVARELRFRPARIGSTPVRVRLDLPIEWTIHREPAQAPPLTPRAPERGT